MLKLRSARVVEVLDVPRSSAGDTVPDPEQSLVVELASPFGGGPRAAPGDRRRGSRRDRRGGRRGGRQRRGPRPRPGLGGLRRRARQPHPRPRRRRGDAARLTAARDEAELHEPPTPGRARRRRGPRAPGGPARWPCSRCTVSSPRWRGRSRSRRPGQRLGYVQTEGGALPGGHSRVVRELRGRGLLAGHLTAGAAFGGEGRGGEHRRCPPPRPARSSAGTRPCAAPDRGSWGPGRCSATAAWPRSTRLTCRSPWAARRWWWRGCPRATSASAIAGSPTTR